MSYFSEMEDQAMGLAQKLFEENTQQEVIADLEAIGEERWNQWIFQDSARILQFLGSTPASRTKKWPDIHIRRRLALAALVYHRFALPFEDAVERFATSKGLSYRDAHKRAANFGIHLFLAFPDSWFPLDDLDFYLDLADGHNRYRDEDPMVF